MRRDGSRIATAHRLTTGVAVLLALASSAVCAHNPHDPALALGVSPNYANDQTVYVSTFAEWNWGYKDVLRSTDGGATWTKLPKGLDNHYPVSAIRVSPSFSLDGTVYAATTGDGVYASVDRGNSWQLINTGLVGTAIGELKIAGSSSGGHTLFAAPTSGGLFVRTSSQNTWTQVISSSIKLTVVTPSPDFATDLTVLAADATGNLSISTDGGLSWVGLGNPAAAVIYDMAIAPGGAREIFLATSRPGIFYSANGGSSFSNLPANLPAEAVNNVAVSPNYALDQTVFCTTPTHSVYKSTNAGGSWTLTPTGAKITGQASSPLTEFSELQVSNTYANDGAVFLSAFDGLFVSSNAGTVWAQPQTRVGLVTDLAFSTNFAADTSVMASNYAEGGLYSSADSGATWARAWDGWLLLGNTLSSFAIEFVRNHSGPPMVVATKNFSEIGFSSDFGATWRVVAIPNMPDATQILRPVYPNVMSVSPQFDTDQEIYLGTRRQGVLHSTNGGASWVASRDVPNKQEIMGTAISPAYAQDHTAIAVTGDGQIWRTTDNGGHWTRTGASTVKPRAGQRVPLLAFSPNAAVDHLVLLGTNNGLYSSTDGGATWKGVNIAPFGRASIIQQVEFSPGFATDQQLYVNVRGRGLYSVAMNASGAVTSSANIGALLDQNVQFAVFHLSPNFSQDATILGASGRDVYRSTDAGVTWTLVGSPHS
jgi:photosystem II stability/assembly factor-like uncharacterized protein